MKTEKKRIIAAAVIALLVLSAAVYCLSDQKPVSTETESSKDSEVSSTQEKRDDVVGHDTIVQKPTDEKQEEPKQEQPSQNTGAQAHSAGGKTENPSGNPASSNEKKGHYEQRQVLVREAYDEQVLVKKGECTSICVQEAYDTQEMVYLDGAYYGSDMQEVYVCNNCGATFTDGSIQTHIDNSDTCGGWHNDYVATGEPYWHNVDYRTVHHDAVYETKCEPDEYKTVHHEAEYKIEQVWVED